MIICYQRDIQYKHFFHLLMLTIYIYGKLFVELDLIADRVHRVGDINAQHNFLDASPEIPTFNTGLQTIFKIQENRNNPFQSS